MDALGVEALDFPSRAEKMSAQASFTMGNDPSEYAELHNNSISRLPAELLVEIIRLSLWELEPMANAPADVIHSYISLLYARRAVARRWWSIIDGTPHLWSFLLSTFPLDVINAIILRSCNCSLAVVCFSKQSTDLAAIWPANFFVTVKHTQERWSSYKGYFVPGMFEESAPALRAIDLYRQFSAPTAEEEDLSLTLNLPGGMAANLRDLEINGIRVPWKNISLADLSSLVLWDIEGDGLTLAQLLDFLRNSPRMERFELQNVAVTISAKPPSFSPITMAYLKTIHLNDCKTAVADHILRRIETPACTQLAVGIMLDSPELNATTFLNQTLQSFQPLFREAQRQAPERSSIIITPHHFQWSGGSSIVDFTVIIEGRLEVPDIDLSIINHSQHNELGTNLVLTEVSDALWARVASLQCVTRISARMDCRGVIERLAQPVTPDSSLPAFPTLQKLELYYGDWLNAELLISLRRRYETLLWTGDNHWQPLDILLPRNPARMREPSSWKDVTLEKRKQLRNAKWVRGVKLLGYKDTVGILGYLWDDGLEAPFWGGYG